MTKVQSFAGYVILILGLATGLLSGSFVIFFISLIGGFLLISLAKLVDINQTLSLAQSGLPLTDSQMRKIIHRSPQLQVESKLFDVYSKAESPLYHLIYLHQEYYIRARVFYEYLRQEEHEYYFHLPDREPITLNLSDQYLAGVELFEHNHQVFVKVSRLGFKLRIEKERLLLE